MNRVLAVVFMMMCLCEIATAQDTLPKFTVATKGNNKILISWTNPYQVISQISIQRSLDSTKNFKTILTVPDPSVLQNGFVDTKAITPFMFYRLFISLDSGKYIFSQSKRAFWDTAYVAAKIQPEIKTGNKPEIKTDNGNKRVVVSENMDNKDVEELKEKLREEEKLPAPEKFFNIRKKDSILSRLSEKDFKQFRDSIVYRTKDTLVFKSLDTILIKPFVYKEVYKASQYVYTEKDGNVVISLPDALKKNYSIHFFEEDNRFVFEIKQVKETLLVLDKVNFLHAGWFRFELFEEGKLKEKHKFLIPKDF